MKRFALMLCALLSISSAQITFTPTGHPTGSGALEDVSGDFNLDGLPDIATTAVYANKVIVLTNIGSGSFSQTASYTVPGAGWIKTADVNHDGKLDLLVASGLLNQSGGGSTNNAILVLLNNGNGTFRFGQTIPLSRYPVDFDVQNFDGDSFPDLLLKQCDYNVQIPLCEIDYYKNAGGTYQLGTVLAAASTNIVGNSFGSGNLVHFADLKGGRVH